MSSLLDVARRVTPQKARAYFTSCLVTLLKLAGYCIGILAVLFAMDWLSRETLGSRPAVVLIYGIHFLWIGTYIVMAYGIQKIPASYVGPIAFTCCSAWVLFTLILQAYWLSAAFAGVSTLLGGWIRYREKSAV